MQDKIITSVKDEPYFYVQTGSDRVHTSRVDSVVYYFPSNSGYIEVDPKRLSSFMDFVDRRLSDMQNPYSTAMHVYNYQDVMGILTHNNIRYCSLQTLQDYFNETKLDIDNINKEDLKRKTIRELERILHVVQKRKGEKK